MAESFEDIVTGFSYSDFPKDPAAREAIAIVNNKVENIKEKTVIKQEIIALENKVKQSDIDNSRQISGIKENVELLDQKIKGIDGGNYEKIAELEEAVNNKAPRDLVDSLLGQIEGSIKQVNGVTPDESGNVNININTVGLVTQEELTEKTDEIAMQVFNKAESSVVKALSTQVEDNSSRLEETTNQYSYTLGFLNELNKIRTRAIVEVNGFYNVDDGAIGKYRVLSLSGNEVWTDIKDSINNTLFQISTVGELRAVRGEKKLKVMPQHNIRNVEMYGIKDDETFLQNVDIINRAINSTESGELRISDGTYMIDTSKGVTFKDNITLRLTDNATLKAIPTSVIVWRYVVNMQGCDNVKLIGGKIYGERNKHFRASTGQVWENNPFKPNTTYAVGDIFWRDHYGYICTTAGITGATVSTHKTGIVANGTAQFQAEFFGEDGHGIYIGSCNNFEVRDTEIYDSLGDGIFLYEVSANGLIENVKTRNCKRQGASLVFGKDITFRGCDMEGSDGAPGAGIDIEMNDIPEAITGFPENILIENCKFSKNEYGVMIVNRAKNVTIRNNDMSDNHNALTFIDAGDVNGQIKAYGNTLSSFGKTEALVRVHGDSENIKIYDNELIGDAPIAIWFHSTTIKNCLAIDNDVSQFVGGEKYRNQSIDITNKIIENQADDYKTKVKTAAYKEYERGEWTPSIFGSVTNGITTYYGRSGSYEKIGNIVHVSCYLATNTVSGLAGEVRINGLPFASRLVGFGVHSGTVSEASLIATAGKQLTVRLIENSTSLRLQLIGDQTYTALDSTQIKNGAVIALSMTYFI